MKFLENIRTNIGYKILNHRQSKLRRNKTFHNLDSAKSVGVVFSAMNDDDYQVAQQFVNTLLDKGKKVESIGCVANQDAIGKYVITNNMKYYSCENQTIFFLPKENEVIEDFVSQNFDILVNISNRENIFLDYIIGLSKAAFKVSPALRDDDYADFIIQFSDKNNLSSKDILEKTTGILSKINRK